MPNNNCTVAYYEISGIIKYKYFDNYFSMANSMANSQLNFLQLFEVIQQKLKQPNHNSYTNKLAQNPSRLVQKIGEEGVETTIAGLLCALQPSPENSQNNDPKNALNKIEISKINHSYNFPLQYF